MIWTPLLLLVAAGPPPELPCEQHAERRISYSEAAPRDYLSIQIQGARCSSSELQIIIRDVGAREVYRYAARFKQHTAMPWDDPELPAEARRLSREIVYEAAPSLSRELPEYGEESAFFYGAEAAIPREAYASVRSQNLPLFCHWVHYESGQCVVFDRQKKKSLVVLRWGW